MLLAACVVVAPPGAAPAAAATSLEAQAGAIQSRIVATAHQLHTLADDVASANARLEAADAALQTDRRSLARLQVKLAAARTALCSIALDAYMRAGDTMELDLFWASPTEVGLSQAYERTASDTDDESIDLFLTDRTAVLRNEATIATERSDAATAYEAAKAEYASLQSTAGNEQAMLTRVQHEEEQQAREQAQQQAREQAQEQERLAQQQAAQAASVAGPVTQGTPATVDISNLGGSNSSLAQDLARLRQCESGDDYQADTGNGYYGAYQFALSTWESLGYSGLPSSAPPPEQDQAATQLEQADGWGQWPVCSAMLGLD